MTSPKLRFERQHLREETLNRRKHWMDRGSMTTVVHRLLRAAFVEGWVARRPTGEVGGRTMPATARMRAAARRAWGGE